MPIKILDDNLINKIAAGEVVDRPASVVKELVENSLDAGADFISIEIKNGGMDLIEVVDNGKGMNKDDARLSVERHATSKIEKIEDLNNISSFGFRGEALSAISSVSRFSLQTKEKGAMSGVLYMSPLTPQSSEGRVKGSDLPMFQVEDIGCSEGTKIRVEEIFYNVPARRKFLKSAQTEFGHILNTLTDIALANSDVRLKIIHNGRTVFDYLSNTKPREKEHALTRKNDDWAQRVKNVLGSNNFNKLIPFYREAGEMVLQGFISSPTTVGLTKGQQYLFVNNRPVYNNIVHKAIYNAYRNLIPSNSHPYFVIKLNLEPEMVDVNVHPRKIEVKFLHQQDVFKTVEAVVREAVSESKFRGSNDLATSNLLNSSYSSNKIPNFKIQIPNKFKNSNLEIQNDGHNTGAPSKMELTTTFSHFSRQISRQMEDVKSYNEAMFKVDDKKNGDFDWKLIGQVKNLYLVVEAEDSLILIDQHAAHERIIYDSIIEKIESANYKAQQLLMPLKIDLSLKEMEIIKQGFGILGKIGFEIEEFGVNTIIVQTVPQDIVGKDVKGIIKGIVNDFLTAEKEELEKGGEVLEKLRNKIICYIACRTAIKQGDVLSLNEQMNLVRKVMAGEVKATCPHGRPIKTLLPWDEIGKKFKRMNFL